MEAQEAFVVAIDRVLASARTAGQVLSYRDAMKTAAREDPRAYARYLVVTGRTRSAEWGE